MPTILLPRQFKLTLPDGRVADFPGPGRYDVDDEIANHPLMRRLVVHDEPAGPPEPSSPEAA